MAKNGTGRIGASLNHELTPPRAARRSSARRREEHRNAARGGLVTVTRRNPDGTTTTTVETDPAVENARAALSSSRSTSRRNRRSAERRSNDPLGTTKRTRRVTAVLGKKPARWTWREYHAIAQKTPWSIPSSPDRVRAPGRRLTGTESAAVKQAHDDLAAGRLTAAEYLEAIARVSRPVEATR